MKRVIWKSRQSPNTPRPMSGWPKAPGPERFDRQAYPYDLTQMLGGDQSQDVDVELNT